MNTSMKTALAIAVTLAVQWAAQPRAAADQTNAPKIAFATNKWDFGKIKQGELVKHDFVFTNTGTADLLILSVKPGCGCTTAGSWDTNVPPGKTGSIPLQFNSAGFSGNVMKSATVTCNDPTTPVSALSLGANVWRPVDVTPQMAVFQFESDGQTNQTRVIKIRATWTFPYRLSHRRF
jgi:hypothetical protein